MAWVVSAVGFAFVSGAAGGGGVHHPPRSSPFWEPPLREFFPPLKDFEPGHPESFAPPGAQIVRRSKVSVAEFEDLIRKGQPFVVDDCAEGWPYMDWTCKDFAKEYPDGNMKSEYSPGQGRQRVGDHGWHEKVRPAMEHKEHISNGKKIAGPYVWHVKDEEPIATKRDIQTRWKPPYFMNETAVNHLEAWDSFEFWFAMPGGGAFAHADSYNEMTISAQLRGRKTWRLGMHPELPTIFDSFSSFDTGIYKAGKWDPEYDFEVGPGSCFVFPPAYIHETYVRPEHNSECTVATTFQFNVPFPSGYIRSFLPRLMNSHLVWQERSVSLWAPYLQIIGEEPLPPTADDGASIDARVDAVLGVVDVDGNGRLDRGELTRFYLEDSRGAWVQRRGFSWSRQVSKEQRKQTARELGESRVGDVLAWHDLDDDGEIQRAELRETTLQWNVLYRKQQALRKLNPGKKKSAEKARKIELDHLRRYGGCEDEASPRHTECLAAEKELASRRLPRLSQLPAYQQEEPEGNDEDEGEQEL